MAAQWSNCVQLWSYTLELGEFVELMVLVSFGYYCKLKYMKHRKNSCVVNLSLFCIDSCFIIIFGCMNVLMPTFSWIRNWSLIVRCILLVYCRMLELWWVFLRECHFLQALNFHVLSHPPKHRPYCIAYLGIFCR